jgi:hypothetical protein
MIALFVYVLALVLLACCWFMGDAEFRTKVILTVIYLASWALVFVWPYAVVAAQAILSIVLGYLTFGPEWLGGRRR